MRSQPYSLDTRRGSFRVCEDGEASAPALVLSNSLGTTLEMWAPQVAAWAQDFRLVRYDTRGHGGSPVTPGPYDFDGLGNDVLAILDALHIERAHFCGLSMGGHTGLWLGIHASDRLQSLVICNSAAKIGTAAAWTERAAMVRSSGADGMRSLAESAPGRWFTPEFVHRQPALVRQTQDGIAAIASEGYAACCEALATSDLTQQLGQIRAPTLLVAGAFDPVTTVADAEAMQASIAGAQRAVVPASHLSNLEAPEAFSQAVLGFLAPRTAAL